MKCLQRVACAFTLLFAAAAFSPVYSQEQKSQEQKNEKPERSEGFMKFQLHWENRVKMFQAENNAYQNIVLLGDSITEGFTLSKHFPYARILNRGIGADVIGNDLLPDDKRGVLKRLNESVFNTGATHLFILIGINDLGMGHTPQQMEKGYEEILKQIKEKDPQLKVYVQSVLPARGGFNKHNPNVLDFNKRIKALAEKYQYTYVDLHSLMTDDNGELKAEFTGDGLHLTDDAYKVWKAKIVEVLGWQ